MTVTLQQARSRRVHFRRRFQLLVAFCGIVIATAAFSQPADTNNTGRGGMEGTGVGCNPNPVRSDSSIFGISRPDLLISDDAIDAGTLAARRHVQHRIGKILITRLSVFDTAQPGENNPLYRWANRFHVMTRDDVIRRELLFRAGDLYSATLLAESARLLRQRDHLNDAAIHVVSVCDDQVDVEVVTQDVWSFTPEASFDRSGGKDLYTIGMRDTNLLGTGTEWSVSIREDLDRRSVRTVIEDENWRGSRIALSLLYDDSDDGRHAFARIQHPFYALDTRSAWLVSQDNLRQVTGQFNRSIERSQIMEDIRETRVWFGQAMGDRRDHIVRWKVGWVRRDEAFEATTTLPPPVPTPSDQVLSYPWISLEGLSDRFATVTNLNQIHRTEDIYVGQSWRFQLGYSHPSLGATDRRWIAEFTGGQTLLYTANTLIQHQASGIGHFTSDDGSEDVQLRYRVQLYHRQHRNRSMLLSAQLDWTDGLRPHRQLSLGGLNGARGFGNRFQTGTRRWQVTAEQRWFTDIHFLNLVRVGYAAFLDTGRASRSRFTGNPDGTLTNVGLGLRFSSSKSDVGKIAHLDVAFPLSHRNDPGVADYELTATIKNSF